MNTPTIRTLTVQTSAAPAVSDAPSLNPEKPDSGPSSFCLDFIASDATLDRCDEIIDPAGWQLDNYRRNPVFQNSHQYGDILFTLGKALITEVRNGKLFQRIQFATDINPMARIAYGLYQAKYLNAVSVGFIPLRWQDAPPSRNADFQSAVSQACSLQDPGHAKASDQTRANAPQPRRRYLEQELLEVSAVGIPANPNALQLGLKSGAVNRTDVKDLSELLKLLITSAAAKHESERKPRNDTRQLLTLAKTLRDALR